MSPTATAAIRSAEHILVSPISWWEVGMLVRDRRIELDRPLGHWISRVMEKYASSSSARSVTLPTRSAPYSSRSAGTSFATGRPCFVIVYDTFSSSTSSRMARHSALNRLAMIVRSLIVSSI